MPGKTDQVENLILQQVLKDIVVIAKKFPRISQASSFQCTLRLDTGI